MAQVNKISSFKSFTEVKNQENTMKLRETNNAKRQETVGKIGAILDEMGLTSLSELDEEKKQALINKMFGTVSEDEAEDIEDELNKLGEPKKLEEGNAFIFAASKAKQDGKSEFEFNGKKYKVTIKKDTGLSESEKNEGNAFGAAVKKAKEDDEDEFEVDGETYKVEEAKRTKFTGKTAHDLYTQTSGKPVEVFVGNDWYSVDPKELKDDKGDSFTGYTQDGSDYELYLKDISFIQESVVNEGSHGMAKKILQSIVDGDSSRAEGIKLSKDLAEHYLNWIKTSVFGKKNENLPLNMLINASFNWGIERQLDPKLKKELEDLKASQKKNESVESIDEARSIAKIQYDWSKLTTSMQATAQNWKVAEGSAKESLLGKLKEMTAQKKALEAELDATIADKDKDLELVVSESKEADEASNILDDLLDERDGDMEELHGMSMEDALDTVETYGHSGSKAKKIAQELYSLCNESTVSEAFNRLPKDVIGNELYLASKNLTNLFNSANAGNDIDPGVIDSIIKQLNTVKKSAKKFNNYDEVAGTVYEGKAKDLKPNHKYTSDYGEVTFIKLNPDGKTMKLHSKETGEIKTDISNAYNMELIESVVNEGTKQFDKDVQTLIKDIKSGYGWIDPEYVGDTWENSSNAIDYSLVKGEVLKRLFDAGLLAHSDENDEEKAGKKVKFSELGAYANESVVNEAEKFKSTKDFEEFCEEIDGMPEQRIKRIMGKDYIDTPGGYRDEAEDYDNDIIEYMISNMGKSDFNELKTWWENNVAESTVTESGYQRSGPSAEATRKAEQLKKLKKLRDHREETDRIKKAQLKRAKAAGSAKESVVTEGKDDYMAKFGSANINLKKGYKHHTEDELNDLYDKLGDLVKTLNVKDVTLVFESTVNEAEVKSDDEFKEYAMAVLKKAFGEDFDEAKAGEVVDGILKKCDGDYGAAVGMLTSSLGESVVTEAFDANYWEDYHEDSTKSKNPGNFQLQQEVEGCVEDWNDNNENGKENEVTSAGEKKVLKLAKEFVKAKGWISSDVIDAMIAQES
jgi:uncharacterized protein with PIN domain